MKYPLYLLLFCVITLSGCDIASDMSGMLKKMELINGDLKSELKMDAQVGWNIHNGALTQMTVVIPSEDAEGKSVRELKDLTYPIIKKHFESDPQIFQVVVSFDRL